MNFIDVKFFLLDMFFIVKLWIVEKINIKYGVFKEICSVFVVNDDEIWMFGDNKMLKFYIFKSELVRKIKIKLGNKLLNL